MPPKFQASPTHVNSNSGTAKTPGTCTKPRLRLNYLLSWNWSQFNMQWLLWGNHCVRFHQNPMVNISSVSPMPGSPILLGKQNSLMSCEWNDLGDETFNCQCHFWAEASNHAREILVFLSFCCSKYGGGFLGRWYTNGWSSTDSQTGTCIGRAWGDHRKGQSGPYL